MRLKRGFSLIEILVVLVIIGIVVGFALLALGDFGASRSATVSAEQFVTYLKLIQQRAILEAATLGVQINKEFYVASRFIPGQGWQSMPESGIFHRYYFPKNITVRFQGSNNNSLIIIDTTGNMTPFQLQFGTAQKPIVILLTGKSNGQLTLQYPAAP